jgi:hypothetical protein
VGDPARPPVDRAAEARPNCDGPPLLGECGDGLRQALTDPLPAAVAVDMKSAPVDDPAAGSADRHLRLRPTDLHRQQAVL